MIKCNNCGTVNNDNEQKCSSCGEDIQSNRSNYIFFNKKWMDRETYMSERILRDSRIVYIVFVILAVLSVFSAFAYLLVTRKLIGFLIIISSGAFIWFLGVIFRNLMQGISITVKNSNKK